MDCHGFILFVNWMSLDGVRGGGQGGPTNTCSIDVFFCCNERPMEFSKKDFNMFMLGHQAISTTQVI